MNEQNKSTPPWWQRCAEWLRGFSGQFEFVREVLIFTFLGWCGAFVYWNDSESLLPYLTAIIIAHIAGLVVLGVARMVVNPESAAARRQAPDESD